VKVRHSDPERLVSLFTELYGESPVFRSLGPEKRIFLESAVAHRLSSYLEALPDDTFIESLERRYDATVATGLGPLKFAGKVDRIDQREDRRIILDYKTGSVEKPGVGHFAKELVNLALPAEYDYEGLSTIREALPDLQLPLYVMLVGSAEAASGASAEGRVEGSASGILSAYVELRAPGGDDFRERYFVRPDNADELGDAYSQWFAGPFPQLLAYLIDHMIKSPCFYRATYDGDCAHCDYSPICGLASS